VLDILLNVDNTIDEIGNSIIVKRLKELKSIINNDEKIQTLLNNFREAKEQYESSLIITEKLITSKKNLYNHPIVSEYRTLYGELNLSINKFNKNILKLLNTNNTCGIN
jgi:cell fate (sporulation/competence/biofilm development) regulator YlbF (YheA/YmcA/DUF963 family)